MREIDLLLREFSNSTLHEIDQENLNVFDRVLDYDDQNSLIIFLKMKVYTK